MATQSPGGSTVIAPKRGAGPTSLVVCSLEPWGVVRRRLRILVDEIVDLDPSVHVLYVSPAVDIPHLLRRGKLRSAGDPRLERVHPRIHVLRPRKWLPRMIGPFADRSLRRQLLAAVDGLGMHHPLLWINDAGYARLAASTGWPSLYDITDDWLLAPQTPREHARLVSNDALLLERSNAVVVCSGELERTRSRVRKVHLIPNGVDVELFRTPRSRPASMPPAPTALYVGTLHQDRLDVPLIHHLADARPELHIALVGPNSLPADVTSMLEHVPNIHLLGPSPYDQVPAFMQHADVVIIPHLVNPFTESLDPIKAYECRAAARPTVATPVAGFRGLGPPIVIADRDHFTEATTTALAAGAPPGLPATFATTQIASWRQRAQTMASLMDQVRHEGTLR